MKGSYRFLAVVLFLGVYLLSACTGISTRKTNSQSEPVSQSSSTEVVFVGNVDSISDTAWQVSGQQVAVDSSTKIDGGIQAGDNVKVEAIVSPDGSVKALKIESHMPNDVALTETASPNSNATAVASATGVSDDSTTISVTATAAPNNPVAAEEVYGIVEAISTESVTVNGVTYNFTSLTEFKDIVSVGDQVKLHVTANAGGTSIVTEIEKVTVVTGTAEDNSNSNGSNGNSNDDSNDDANDD